MIIQCEKCRTKFNVDETALNFEGSKVKCSRCKNIFLVFPPEHLENEEDLTVAFSEEELGTFGQTMEADLEDMDLDDVFEEESMEDIEDIETDYHEDLRGIPEESHVEEAILEEEREIAGSEFRTGTEEASKPIIEKKKNKFQTLLISLVIILLLLGIGYVLAKWFPGVFPHFFASSEKQSSETQQTADMGASRLEILTVNGFFVDSDNAGRLFVIRGKIRNSYDKSRSFILVKASILDDKGKVVREKSAYAGNIFEEEELRKLPLAEISERMKNRLGLAKNNFNIEPGTSVDFEIVFENLPDNLSEFTVGAVSSSPGGTEQTDQS